MNKWRVLGILETKDKNKIREGYLSRLAEVHPEEDPEGFKLLRSAYEEALKYSKEEIVEKEIEELSEVDQWIEKAKNVYNNFSFRVSEEKWREILQEPVAFSLDTREEVLEKLLVFFMNYFYLPNKIWRLLDKHFNISSLKEELCEKFPSDFINYVIYSINYTGAINYDLFKLEDDKDYDGWITLYLKINRELNNNEDADIEGEIEELRAFNIDHPYADVLMARYYINKDKTKEAKELIDKYMDFLDYDISIVYCMAKIQFIDKNYEEAESLYRKILELDENNINGKIGLADVLQEKGDVQEARKIYIGILREDNYNLYIRMRMESVNEKIIQLKEEQGIENIEDIDEKFDLAWCYYENSNYKKAIEVAETIKPRENEDERQVYDILARSNSALGNHKRALEIFEKWLDDEKDEKSNRLAYIYDQKGNELFKLEKYEEALSCYDEASKIEEYNLVHLIGKCRTLNKLERYRESLEINDLALNIDKSIANIYYYRAEALFHLKYYKDVLETCDAGLRIISYYKELYILKLRVLDICGQNDKVLEVVEEIKKYNIKDEEIDLYNAKALMNLGKKEGYEILKRLMKSENNDISSRAYYESSLNMSNDDVKEALRMIDISINKNKNWIDPYFVKAYLYRIIGKNTSAINVYKETIEKFADTDFVNYQIGQVYLVMSNIELAKEYFHKVEEINGEHQYVNGDLSEIYEKEGDDEKALEYVNKQLNINPSEYYYIHRGLIYDRNNELDKAEIDYKSAIKENPESKHAYNNLGYIYQQKGLFLKAVESYKKAIELSEAKHEKYINPYNNLANCYMYINEYEKALGVYNKAILIMPSKYSLYLNKGILLKKLRKYQEALLTFNKGRKKEGANEKKFCKEVADTYFWLGEYEKSIAFYKEALKMDPNDANIIREIILCYEEERQYIRAYQYVKLLKEKLNDAINYIIIGDYYRKNGRLRKSKIYYKSAISKYENSKNTETKININIGECYRWLGDRERAILLFKKAIEGKLCACCIGRGCHEGYYKLGEIYEEDGNYELALKYYEKALEIERKIEYYNAVDRIKEFI